MPVPTHKVEGGLPIADAVRACPELAEYLVQTSPPKMDLGNRDALKLYNEVVCREVFGLEVDYGQVTGLIPTPVLKYNFLKRVIRPGSHLLEVGTGPTALVSMLAAKLLGCTCVATEVDSASVQVAMGNVARNGLGQAVEIRQSSGGVVRGVVQVGESFDFVVSNPPYYPAGPFPSKSPWAGTPTEVVGHGTVGERFIVRLVTEGVGVLRPGGCVAFAVPVKLGNLVSWIEQHLGELGSRWERFDLVAGNRRRRVFTVRGD
ncbi:MAG: RlmF-related methyltransferase [Promethearchaeota archaeon]